VVLLLWMAVVPLSAQTTDVSSAERDKKFHEDVLTLVDVTGLRQRLLDGREKSAEEGRQTLLRRFPNYSPAFADEWAKRMVARMQVDDYVKVIASVYEKHFTDAEILELIQMQRDANTGKTPTASAHLKEKLTKELVDVQSEIIGGCTQLGAKLGGAIGEELAREHPEWVGATKGAAESSK